MIKLNFINLITCLALAMILSVISVSIGAPPVTGLFIGILSPTIMRLIGLPVVEIKND
jgi:hypothetical protein